MAGSHLSNNSSRLSLALIDLPLTPFGMRSPVSCSKKKKFQQNCNSPQKLSRLCLKSREANCNSPPMESHWDKENCNFPLNLKNVNTRRRKHKIVSKSPDRVKENIQRNNEISTNFPFDHNAGRHKELTNHNFRSHEHTERRDSLFTDIDDGSFIEFTSHQEIKSKVFKPLSDPPLSQFYYTCAEDNETKYSTSSKTPQALVGFHKFINAVRSKSMDAIEESCVEIEPNLFRLDETVIAGSRDMFMRRGKSDSNLKLNSTEYSHHFPAQSGFPDISTLTINNTPINRDSTKNCKLTNANKHIEFIVISETDDESELEQSAKSSAHDFQQFVQKNYISDKNDIIMDSLMTEDISITPSVPQNMLQEINSSRTDAMATEQQDIRVKTRKQRASKSSESEAVREVERDKAGGDKSSDKHEYANRQEKNVSMNEDRGENFNIENNKEGRNADLVKEIEQQEVQCASEVDKRVLGWVLTSPFKEGSFGSSFLNIKHKLLYSPQQSESPLQSESLESSNKNSSNHLGNTIFTLGRIAESPESPNIIQSPNALNFTQDESSVGDDIRSSKIVSKTLGLKNLILSSDDSSDSLALPSSRIQWTSGDIQKNQENNCISDSSEVGDDIRSSKIVSKTLGLKNLILSSDDSSDSLALPSSRIQRTSGDIQKNQENNCISDSSEVVHSSDYDKEITVNPDGKKYRLICSAESLNITKKVDNNSAKNSETRTRSFENSLHLALSSDNESQEYKNFSKSKLVKEVDKKQSFDQFYSSDISPKVGKCRAKLFNPDNSISQSRSQGVHAVRNSLMQYELSKSKSDNLLNKSSSLHLNWADYSDDVDVKIIDLRVRAESLPTPTKPIVQETVPKSITGKNKSINKISDMGNMHTPPGKISGEGIFQQLRRELDMLNNGSVQGIVGDQSNKPCPNENKNLSLEDSSLNVKKHIRKKHLSVKHVHSFSDSSDEDSFNNCINNALRTKYLIKKKGEEDFVLDSSEATTSSDSSPIIKSAKKNFNIKSSDFNKITLSTNHKWRKPSRIIPSSSSDSDEDTFPHKTPKRCSKIKISRKMENKNFISVCPLSFLASLAPDIDSDKAHPAAIPFIGNFKKCKEALTSKLYDYFNTHVFCNKLPETMNIKWNSRMTKTAGYCYYQIDRAKESGRAARIELSSKVIDAPGRLRDTLIHEMCHAASWIISGYKDGHGPLWKSWAYKAMKAFPELPVISRCHGYEITCKYTYRCTKCGYSIGRHSKSLDTEKKVCGYCYSKFELLVNYVGRNPGRTPAAKSSLEQTPKTHRTPNRFAMYVKENYGSVKRSKKDFRHGDIMKALSEEFAKLKTKL